jgi:hypothetical protein
MVMIRGREVFLKNQELFSGVSKLHGFPYKKKCHGMLFEIKDVPRIS